MYFYIRVYICRCVFHIFFFISWYIQLSIMLFEHDRFIQVTWESVKIGESLQIAGQMFKFTRRQLWTWDKWSGESFRQSAHIWVTTYCNWFRDPARSSNMDGVTSIPINSWSCFPRTWKYMLAEQDSTNGPVGQSW